MKYLLTVFVLFFIWYILINWIKKFKESENNSSSPTSSDSLKNSNSDFKIETNFSQFYRPKRYLITKNELEFYTILLEICKELDLILFSQVSLYNIVELNNVKYNETYKYFNKIASKSIDFVLVDKTNCRIKLCIELDDSTHKQKNRIERDKFIDKLFKDLEIDLLRYPVYNIYYKETLKKRIQESIHEHYTN